MRLSRCEVRDRINYRENDRWSSYRFYGASQRLKSPMRYVSKIFGTPRFSSFSTETAYNGHRWAGLFWLVSSGVITTGPAEAEIEAGVTIARHTHPGIESAYIIEGGLDLPIEGQPTRALKPGDGFQVPPNTPHAGGKNGDKKTKIAITYVLEKGKPIASPA